MADTRRGWTVAATLAITETVSWGILYYAFAVFLDPLARELATSRGVVSGSYAVALLVSGLAAPMVGRWVDAGRGRTVMTGGAIAGVALVAAWSTLDSIAALYLVQAGIGLAMACVLYEPAMAVVVRRFPGGAQRPLLLLTLVAGFASTIFLPVSGVLVERSGWRAALLALAAVLATATVVPHALALRGETAITPPASAEAVTSRALLADATFRWLTVAFALATVATVVISVHLVAVLSDRGLQAGAAAAVAGGLGLLSVTGRVVLTLAERRWAFSTLMAGVFTAQAAALVVLATMRGAAAVVVFVLFYGAGFGAMTIARPVIVATLFGARSFGSISGTLHGVVTVAKAAAPLAAGVAVTRAGSYTPVLWTLAVVVGLAAAAMVPVVRDHRLVRARPTPAGAYAGAASAARTAAIRSGTTRQ